MSLQLRTLNVRHGPRSTTHGGRLTVVLLSACVSCIAASGALAAESAEPKPKVEFTKSDSQVSVAISGRTVATYVYSDDQIRRPYFANLKALDGTQVTRNHPPIEGQDSTDHATMHPGLWLAFGRLGGADFWRNRADATVEHARFTAEPQGGDGVGHFAVLNRYVAKEKTVCEETSRVSFHVRPGGYLIVVDSVLRSSDRDLVFGDQQEMGLGVRVATPIAVKANGKMIDSAGRVNERGIWGKQADWCGVSGRIAGKRAGILLMPDPANFRPCRFHARDYGALVANPFGVKDFGRGAESRVTVKKDTSFRLRFGILLHSGPPQKQLDRRAAYADYLEVLEPRTKKKKPGPAR